MILMCEVCKAPLSVTNVTDETGVATTVQHPPFTNEDHAPDPVWRSVADRDVSTMVCDCCSSPEPVWLYATKPERFELKEVVRATATDDAGTGWAVCGPCSEFVDRRDVRGLAERVLRTSVTIGSMIMDFEPGQRAGARRLYKRMLVEHYLQFFECIRSDKQPLRD